MLINVAIVIFLLATTYWFYIQGFFSSLIHLTLVIASGCIAFAVWEPLGFKLLGMGGLMGQFAYCIALIMPFAIVLLGLRLAFDKVVKGNLFFIPIVDGVGGMALGFVASALTAGLFLLSINFSPLAKDFLGYEPVVVNSTGKGAQYVDGDKLWVPADAWAASFFSRLAGGAMAPTMGQDNLANAYPNLLLTAQTWRQHPDPNSLRVATPEAVNMDAVRQIVVDDAFKGLIPESLKELLGSLPNGSKLLIAETTWKKSGGTYDNSQVLRVGPNQIAINLQSGGKDGVVPPSGFLGDQGYQPFESTSTVAKGLGNSSGDKLGFVFVLPANRDPQSLYVRGLRFPIDKVDPAVETMAERLMDEGTGVAQTPDDTAVAWLGGKGGITRLNFGAGDSEVLVERTNNMPHSASKNSMRSSDTVQGDSESGLLPGDNALFAAAAASKNALKTFKIDDNFVAVRLKVTPRQMQSMHGRALQMAANLSPLPRLKDVNGNTIAAVAFATDTPGEGMRVFYQSELGGLERELGSSLNKMGDNTELYLYFPVRAGRHIVGYTLAGGNDQFEDTIDFYVPAEDEVKPE